MQTSIAIDSNTRDRAAKRAEKELLPLATVVRILLNDYADGRLHIGVHTGPAVITEEIPVDTTIQKKMDMVTKKWRGKVTQ